MKKLIIIGIIFLFSSFSFGQNYGKDFEDMSQTEKMLMYNSHKKSPMVGILYSWFFPSLGHAYANNWKRGTYFLAGEVISIVAGIYIIDESEDIDEDIGFSMIFVVAPIISILEKVDAYKEVKRYNHRIYKDIFGKEPPSFSLNLQPTYQGANLNLSYSFK